MGRAARRLALVAVALAGLALALAGGADGAARTTTCNVKSLYQKPGYPQYVTGLAVAGVSCPTGVSLIKAYYVCRVRSGGPFYGRCHRKVLGFSCTEQRHAISFTYYATVTCRRGRATVVHQYNQSR